MGSQCPQGRRQPTGSCFGQQRQPRQQWWLSVSSRFHSLNRPAQPQFWHQGVKEPYTAQLARRARKHLQIRNTVYRQGDFAFAEKRQWYSAVRRRPRELQFLRTTDCFQFGLAALVVSYPDTSAAPDANGALSRC